MDTFDPFFAEFVQKGVYPELAWHWWSTIKFGRAPFSDEPIWLVTKLQRFTPSEIFVKRILTLVYLRVTHLYCTWDACPSHIPYIYVHIYLLTFVAWIVIYCLYSYDICILSAIWYLNTCSSCESTYRTTVTISVTVPSTNWDAHPSNLRDVYNICIQEVGKMDTPSLSSDMVSWEIPKPNGGLVRWEHHLLMDFPCHGGDWGMIR